MGDRASRRARGGAADEVGPPQSDLAPPPRRVPMADEMLPMLPPTLPMRSLDEARPGGLTMDELAMQRAASADGSLDVQLGSIFTRLRRLRHGSYYLRYVPGGQSFFRPFEYRGTLRVERHGLFFNGNTVASGDLYFYRRPIWFPFPIPRIPLPRIPDPGPLVPPFNPGLGLGNGLGGGLLDGINDGADGPDPAAGIPLFPRSKYTYYLRITQILETFTFGGGFTLGFTRHRFNRTTNTFTAEGDFTAYMEWKPAPAGYPDSSQYLEGELRDSAGAPAGTLTMGWVSPYLRRATVEIDRVSASEPPLNSGAGHTWRSIFDAIGWDVTVVESNADVAEPSGESWSDAEMHAAMLARRDSADLDGDWRYHILCVRRIDSTPRGIMYDRTATDSNNVPREGIGIATHWIIPNSPEWGRVRGVRFGAAAAPYFRTALHEIGHAMGLYHNTVDFGIMNTTDVISFGAVLPQQFPDNIKWAHADDDRKRLKHLPDIWVRPGGTPFGLSYASAPISPDDRFDVLPGLEFTAAALLATVPIGAPVRVDLELTNRSGIPLPAPAELGFRGGCVRGKVVDPTGTARTFSPLVLCMDDEQLRTLDPGESEAGSLTLLRGGQGALFPMAGPYRISVELDWDVGGIAVGTTAEAMVMVTPASDPAHAEAALRVLSEPDTLPAMVIGGDHLVDGVEAIQAAVDNPDLRPHYAIIEAKRIAKTHGQDKKAVEQAADLVSESTIASEAEIRRMAQVMSDAKGAAAATKDQVGKSLKAAAKRIGASDDTLSTLDAM